MGSYDVEENLKYILCLSGLLHEGKEEHWKNWNFCKFYEAGQKKKKDYIWKKNKNSLVEILVANNNRLLQVNI